MIKDIRHVSQTEKEVLKEIVFQFKYNFKQKYSQENPFLWI